MENVGARLRAIRQQRQLSLREVEEHSLRLAEEWGNEAYHISASWLVRLERGQYELTVRKLIALADVFNLSPEQLLGYLRPEDGQSLPLQHLSSPNATILLTGGRLTEQAKYLLSYTIDQIDRTNLPETTTLLPAETDPLPAPYRRGIIGKLDRTLYPMIPSGSIVYIDTRKRSISPRKDWIHEFQRPIYVFMTGDAYLCGWCELDRNAEWLTLIPHPLSPASSQRWRYRKEIENVGRVLAVAMRLT